ncbi:RISC-loading complex subunit tarbp2, partial [Calypte anna]
SLEQMLAANPGKTPISLLQEYGTRLGKTPGYDLLKAEGQAHQPNFTFRVTVGDISCTAASPHLGASSPSQGLSGSILGTVPSILGPVLPIRASADPFWGQFLPFWGLFSLLGPQASADPFWGHFPPFWVPFLPPQELVVQKGWRLPEYTVTQESGPAHRKEFTMTCRVERFLEIGSGTSKKLAKRNAAAKMLLRIHNVPVEPRE